MNIFVKIIFKLWYFRRYYFIILFSITILALYLNTSSRYIYHKENMYYRKLIESSRSQINLNEKLIEEYKNIIILGNTQYNYDNIDIVLRHRLNYAKPDEVIYMFRDIAP